MSKDNKSPAMQQFLDELSLRGFGRSRSLALAGQSCVKCGKSATEFRDEISRREYLISALCQQCQNDFFKNC